VVSVIAQDVRYALRSLARAPGFTLVALVTLALGIGGTTAIFSVVDGILLRPLPYPNPSAIVSVSRSRPESTEWGAFSAGDYLTYKQSARGFIAVAGFRPDVVDLSGDVQPVRLDALETTAGFFDVFGARPLLGRVYGEATDARRGPRVVVVSEGFWRTHLASDANVVGRILRLNAIPTTIVGVMPASFVHPAAVEVWMLAPNDVPTSPVAIEGDPLADREVQYFQVIGRLRPDVTLAQANSDLQLVADRLAREFPETTEEVAASAMPLQERLVGDVRSALLVLLGAVGFVLLIACANVASLLLARGTTRRRELAVRAALGAGRWRLVRQLLTESLVLASAGGVLGLVVAYWGIDGLLAVAPESIPRLEDVRLDPRVMAFAVAASAAVGVLFGIVPALQGARSGVTDALKDGGRTGTARTATQRLLVVSEVALALVLLIGAGLMLTSFARLRAVDPGFTVSELMVIGVPLPQARYSTPAQAAFYTQLFERLRENPVTARSALGFPTPFGNANASGGYTVEGAPVRPASERVVAQIGTVTPGFFQTMGIPLLRGRDLGLTDTKDRAGVAVINQRLAEREWPGADPLGKRISLGGNPSDPSEWLTIVGVVGDSKRQDLRADPGPAVYVSHHTFTLPFMSVIVRSHVDEAAVANAVRAAVRTLDPELPLGDVETLERVLDRATGQPRFRATLIGAFAAAALLLAGVGLYGLISYTVAQRIPEIGVRLALGATPAQVGRLVLGQGLTLAMAGVVLGLIGAASLAKLLEGLLFSISATDPMVYSALAALLLTIAALACYVPARRAMGVDPMTALRAE
jgi:putative ABC transport system permease protein